MAVELKQVLCMKEGTDETSYAKSSYISKQVLSLTKAVKEKALRELYGSKQWPTTICIADLGCSSAELNTLSLIAEIIGTIEKASRELGNGPREYQVYLNDLPGNDFNTIFRSLGSFEDKLKQQVKDDFGHCFVLGVPGSFHSRLFPSNHLHFVHSSYSLHWLSQVPKDIESNKENIFIARTSPRQVLKAYSDQFEKDFSTFLRCRSEEVVAEGVLVLTVVGRKNQELYSESCYMFDLLGTTLNDMVNEGLIEEEKLNSFNIPFYTPSAAELAFIAMKEGSFEVSEVHVSEVSWDAKEYNQNASNNCYRHYDFAKCMRSCTEPLLKSYFGEAVIEEVFRRYKELVQDSMAKEKNVIINVTTTLKKRDAQVDILDKVFELEVNAGTNFTKGLEEAVRVVKDRQFTKGRKCVVMLISHGTPYPLDTDGSQVPIHDVPVYTFGLGPESSPTVTSNYISGPN